MEDTLTDLDKAAILATSKKVVDDIERGVFVTALRTMTSRSAVMAGRLEEMGDTEYARYVRTAVAALDDAREAIEGGLDR